MKRLSTSTLGKWKDTLLGENIVITPYGGSNNTIIRTLNIYSKILEI